jgi:hypothetical protein
VTGERAVIRISAEQTAGELLVADLYVRPGGAITGNIITLRSKSALLFSAGSLESDCLGG